MEETVATDELLLAHVTLVSTASEGETVSANTYESPTDSANALLSRVTPVTCLLETVTAQVALTAGFDTDATVIVAVPALLAVTVPFETVATDVLLLDQETDLFSAFDGETVTVSVSLPPPYESILSDRLVLLSFTLVTGSVAAVTVTVQVALAFGFETDVAVIVAVPAPFAFTTPFVTVATDVLLLDQVMPLSVAFDGVTVTANVSLPPPFLSIFNERLVLLSFILVTGMVEAVTVTLQVALTFGFDAEVAVIVADPAPFAVTTPFDTVATELLLLDQETDLS